jgi:hypothetical protein
MVLPSLAKRRPCPWAKEDARANARAMGFEKWAENGRIAALCDRCGARLRTEAVTAASAHRAVHAAGWMLGARTEHASEVTCVTCWKEVSRRRVPLSTDVPRGTSASIVGRSGDRFTSSFVDATGAKRFLLWKPPPHQQDAAARAFRSSEDIRVHAEGRVRVTFHAA